MEEKMLQAVKGYSARITGIKREDAGLCLYMEKGMLRIKPESEKVIRISMTQREKFSENCGIGIMAGENYADWTFCENKSDIWIGTKMLKVCVGKETGAIRYYDDSGTLLLAEQEKNSKQMEAFQTYKTVIDDQAQVREIKTADGVKSVIDHAARIPDKELYHTTIRWNWQQDEVLYGLGQHEDGILNLRGTIRYLHQANLKIAIPMMLSTNGYGLLIPTGSPAIFSDLPYEDSYFYTEADEELNYYFLYGPSFDEVISGYRKLSGKAAMLPKWMFGYIQSQERYETQKEILEVSEEIRRRGIGADVIVQDWHYWEEGLWGQKSFDKKRYPNPQKMIDRLHQMDMRYMISIWPNMSKDGSNYAEMDREELLFPTTEIYNAFEEAGRQRYWQQAYDGLYRYGVDAWWCDSSEPFTPEWTRNPKPLPPKMYEEYLMQTQQMMPAKLGNAYGLYHAEGIYEGQRKTCPNKRLANLTRNGYIGSQKYGVVLWSGDIYASWDTYRRQIAVGLNFCASGLPYWTLDIGGFFVKKGEPWYWAGEYEKGTEDLGYRELYVRWYQFGAFLPVFRSHGTDCRRELWQFGEEGTPFYDALMEANRLRYRLLPYIYSCAGKVWEEDGTMIRLLAFDFPEDRSTWLIRDQYMFGPSIMVCPVTFPMYYEKDSKPLEKADKKRKVYLPEGTCWYNFWTDEKYKGGQSIEVEAPLDRMPLLIREGSILPMTAGRITRVGEQKNAGIEFHVYPGCDGAYELYEDAGDGYEYEAGNYSKRRIIWKEAEYKLEIAEIPDNDWSAPVRGTVIHERK